MGKKSAPKAPNYAPIADASLDVAKLQAKTAEEQLAWAKEQWAEQKQVLDDVLETQLPMMDEQWRIAQEDRARYEELYQPMEEDYLEKAKSWDSAERRAAEAAKAQADVATQFESQRQNALRSLESYGVDPSQTRHSALDLGVRMEQAKASAQQSNAARRQVEKEGLGMMGESINVGRGMASQGMSYAGQSLAAGQAGVGSSGQWQGASSAMGSPTAWSNLANQGFANTANIMNMGHQNKLGSWQATTNARNEMYGQIAGAVGMGAGLMMADGGEVRGPGGPRDDAIPARLSDGEYIIPAHVVSSKGTEFFDKLIAQSEDSERSRMEQATASRDALAIPPPEAVR